MNNPQAIEKHILQLVEKLPLATVISAGNTENIPLLNDAFSVLFGYVASDFPDVDDWWVLVYPDEAYRAEMLSQWSTAASRAIDERSTMDPMETTITCKDGSTRHVEVTMSSIGLLNIVTFIDLTDHKMAQEEQERLLAFSISSRDALLQISRLPVDSLEAFFAQVVEIDAKTLNVTQVGVWFFSDDHSEFIERDTYICETGSHEHEDLVQRLDYPNYFAALDAGRIIDAFDAQNDPRTSEFAESYLIPHAFVSILDAPIRRNGKVIGAVCHEQAGTEKRTWTRLEQDFAASVADMIAVALEVFDRKQAEVLLKTSENALSTAINAMDEYLHVIDCEMRVVLVNDAFVEKMRSLGFAGDPVGVSIRELFPFLPEKVFNEYSSVFKNGTTLYTEEVSLLHGRLYYTEATKIPIYEGNKVVRVLTRVSDMTEHKKSEATLKESEERYRDLFESSPIGVWEEDLSGVKADMDILKANGVKDFRKYFEEKPDEVMRLASLVKVLDVNQKSLEFFEAASKGTITRDLATYFDEDSAVVFCEELIALSEGKSLFQAEIPICMPAGGKKILAITLSISPAFAHTWSRVLVSFFDISDRKEAEEKREADELRLQSLLKISEHHTTTSGEILDFALNELVDVSNSQFGYIYGYDEDKREFILYNWSKEVMGQCSIPSPPKSYILGNTGLWGEAVRQRKAVIVNDFTAPNPLRKGYPEGHAPIYRFLTIPVIIEGEIVGVAGLANKPTDYTTTDVRQLTVMMDSVWKVIQRAQAEEALHESERKYRLLFENMIAGFALHEMVYDELGKPIDYRYLEINPTFEKLTGVTASELLGKTVKEVMPNTEDYWIETYARVAETGEPIAYQNYAEELGKYYDTWSFSPSKGQFAVVFSDITERKQAENEAAASRAEAEKRAAEMESFVSNIADGVALYDVDGNLVAMNEAGRAILGAPKDAKFEDWLIQTEYFALDGARLPDDQIPAKRALHGETVQDMRVIIKTPWGKELGISTSVSPIISSQGELLGATVVFRDQSERIELEQKREELYEREHKIAQALQEALLPHELPVMPGCEMAVIYEAASREAEVGGDFYDAFEIGNGKLAVSVGDVTGKGLPAAARVASARHTIRSCTYINSNPSRVMTMANEVLCKSITEVDEGILTAVFAVVDTFTGEVTISNGGHEPVVLRRSTGAVEQICIEGRVLGVLGGFTYPEVSYKLDAGDMIVMVTDGITESRRSGGELFGIEGVMDFLAHTKMASCHDIASGLVDAAKAYCGGKLRDDAAVLVLVMKDKSS